MGIEDGGFGVPDWLQDFGQPGDPMAGSSWTDVLGNLSSTQTAPFSQALPTGLDSTSGDWIRKIMSMAQPQAKGQPGTNAGDLSSVLGAFSSGEKANRAMQGNLTQGYDRLMLDAQKDRNSNESDALKKLAQTSYITGGGSKFAPPNLSLNGKTHASPDLGFGPQASTDAEKQGASALQPQLQARLMSGGSYTPQPLNDYAKPGLAENIGSYGAAGVGALGALQGLDGQSSLDGVGSAISGISKGIGTLGTVSKLASGLGGIGGGAANAAAAAARAASGGSMVAGSGISGAGSAMSNILGKTVPLAGAAMGAYGLAKNDSVGSDVMSGAGAGASLGSFGGPIGMAAGAGIGALVGALRGAFSVTGKEHAGRDAQSTAISNLGAIATPEQKAGAAKSGWPDTNQALALIVMRDKLTQSGVPGPQAEAQAEQFMHSMWDSEKSGADAVNKAVSPIQSMMANQPGQTVGAPPQSGGSIPPQSPIMDAFSRGAFKG